MVNHTPTHLKETALSDSDGLSVKVNGEGHRRQQLRHYTYNSQQHRPLSKRTNTCIHGSETTLTAVVKNRE